MLTHFDLYPILSTLQQISFRQVILKGLMVMAIATTASLTELSTAQAQLEVGISAPIVSNAGTLNRGNDHFLDIAVNGEMPLDRVRVVCITFHELTGVTVVDAATGADIPFDVAYGFEEFTVTFAESLEAGKTARIIMEDSSVRGRREGLTVPYRVFATYSSLGEDIPIGTALIALPDMMNR